MIITETTLERCDPSTTVAVAQCFGCRLFYRRNAQHSADEMSRSLSPRQGHVCDSLVAFFPAPSRTRFRT
jgi:hypothetical protein